MRVIQMSTEVEAPPTGRPAVTAPATPARKKKSPYPYWFYLPAAVIFFVFFVVPTFSSFFFSLTRWDLSTWEFIGLDNYIAFFQESALITGLKNTLIYAVVTCGLKVVLGMLLALLLTSQIMARGLLRSVVFFPVLVSTIGVGLTFQVLMDPSGLINDGLALVGINGPAWLVDPKTALLSVALVDVWKGVGLATVIFIAGIVSIPREYFEAAASDGASAVQRFWKIILPLSRPAISTVIILALIGGLRSFDLIWAMTRGGPGFTSDVIASVIYKQYQAGFYGLSTAGNVVLFLLVTAIVFPLFRFLNRREVDQ
jgi:raffinose/stachyose/melibiose transport system permease protein